MALPPPPLCVQLFETLQLTNCGRAALSVAMLAEEENWFECPCSTTVTPEAFRLIVVVEAKNANLFPSAMRSSV